MNLNTVQVVAWLREQSARFGRMADEIETAFGSLGPLGTRQIPRSDHIPTIEEVKKYMGDRSMRLTTLARELGVTEKVLYSIMTAANGFRRGHRGWISVVHNGSKTAEHASDTLSEGGDL